jgi:hypothetical protein
VLYSLKVLHTLRVRYNWCIVSETISFVCRPSRRPLPYFTGNFGVFGTAESEFPFHIVFLRSLCCTLLMPVDLSLDTYPLYIKQHIHHSWSSQLECIFHIFSVLLSVLYTRHITSTPAPNGSTRLRRRQQWQEERRRETAAPPPWRRPVAHPARLLLLRLLRERVSIGNHIHSCWAAST